MSIKGVRNVANAAAAAYAVTPMGRAATAIYEQFVEGEDELGKDFNATLPRFAKRGWQETLTRRRLP